MKLKIGDKASLKKHFSRQDVDAFAFLSKDSNPLHADSQLARDAMFGQPIVHGFLVAGLISAVLGTKLPGPGTIYLSQDLNFKAPVYLGDEVTASVEVTKIRAEKGIVTLKTICKRSDGTVVIDGVAIVMHPELKETAN